MAARVEFCGVDAARQLAQFLEIHEDSSSDRTLSDVLLELYSLDAVLSPSISLLSTSDLRVGSVSVFSIGADGQRVDFTTVYSQKDGFKSQT